jgi:hypothetical protein
MKIYEHPPCEISHTAHLAHKLKLVTAIAGGGAPFRCDGCKEPGRGDGRRYRCDNCDFDLHTSCALLPDTTTTKQKHPFYGDLEFEFLLRPPPPPASTGDAKLCNACGHATLGFVYCWSEKKEEVNLHPCCAALRMETVLPDGHMLQLCKEAKQGCLVCGEKARPPGSAANSNRFWRFRKEKLWAYRWQYGGNDGYVHVACMKKIAAQSWEDAYQDCPGGGVVEAAVPVMKSMLLCRPSSSASSAEIGIAALTTAADIGNAISQAQQ